MRTSAWALAIAVAVQPAPARAFELFGVHLWGEKSEDPQDVVVDPIAYEIELRLLADDRPLQDDLEEASLLIAKRSSKPSGAVGLLQRARDDQANLVGMLYEKGYFGAVVRIEIAGRAIEDMSVSDMVADGGDPVLVRISIEPGPVFTFGTIAISGMSGYSAGGVLSAAGLVSGVRASSIIIRNAANQLVIAAEREGHPYAKISGQDIIADHAANVVDVTLVVDPGPYALIGAVEVTGADTLDPSFLERQAEIPAGVPYNPDILEQARKNLARIDALGSVIVKPGTALDEHGRVPIVIEVSERKARTLGAGAYYSSTDGPGGEFFWLHRNLLGEGERLRFELEAGREVTSDSYDNFDTYNWRASFQFDKPGIHGPRVDWIVKGMVLQEDTNPYFRRGGVIETGVAYRLSDEISLTGGISYDYSYVEDFQNGNYYSTLSMPFTATYDTRNDRLNPTSGFYARLLAEPDYVTDESTLYLTGDSEVRLYRAIDEDERLVLAVRARVGSIVGTNLTDVPPHRRFYAGGGGSVRGYDYLGIGPRLEDYGPTGGMSRIDGSIEARIKVTDTIGVVPFVDGGFVAETPLLGGDEEFRWSVGLGLRYYTAVGPIRLDAAVPINPGSHDPDFAVYFGIGQSF